jgi:hypothetical protein
MIKTYLYFNYQISEIAERYVNKETIVLLRAEKVASRNETKKGNGVFTNLVLFLGDSENL